MNVTQCDNCRKLGPVPAWGWIVMLVQQQQELPFLPGLFGGGGGNAEVAGTFCSWRCAGEYAVARALVAEAGGTS